MIRRQDALEYHALGRPGKIEVVPTKPCTTQRDLSLAYSPGVAEPTFGAISLEDIKAPECFYIEEQLKRRMNIPVFHDDQHGTAIITGAALLNAAHIAEKNLADLKILCLGAGAAAVRCMELWVK